MHPLHYQETDKQQRHRGCGCHPVFPALRLERQTDNAASASIGRKYLPFDLLPSSQRFHRSCQRAQMSGQTSFAFQSEPTTIAIGRVTKRAIPRAGFQQLSTRQIENHVTKVFAIHAKHLADLMAAFAGLSSLTGRSFSSRSVLALCKRDRTVPTAQFRTFAASR